MIQTHTTRLLSIIVLLMIITGALVFIRQKEPSAQDMMWRDYKNSSMGISVKYPADWIMAHERDDIRGMRVDFQSPTTMLSLIRKQKAQSATQQSQPLFADLIAEERGIAKNELVSDFTEETITVDGKRASFFAYTWYRPREQKHIRVTSIYGGEQNIQIHFFVYDYEKSQEDRYMFILETLLKNLRIDEM